MKRIIINRKPVDVSIHEERIAQRLRACGYVTRLSDFETGRGSYKNNTARQYVTEYLESPCGFRIWSRYCLTEWPARVRKWFAANPRNQYCVAGNPRRVNLILQKLEESES